MTVLSFFIIRNKKTGQYLPPGMGSGARGTTHQDLVTPCETRPPKLYHTEAAAKSSLTWWLKGVTSVNRFTIGSSWEGYETDESWGTEPDPSRIAEDMEIAQVDLHL